MVEIKSEEDLEAWLKERPREDAMVLADRAPLRVLPIIWLLGVEDEEHYGAAIALPIFRTVAMRWIIAVGPARGAEVRDTQAAAFDTFNAALSAIDNSDTTIVENTLAEQFGSTVGLRDGSAKAPGLTAHIAKYWASAGHATWNAMSADAMAMEQRQQVATTPLWPDSAPTYILELWAEMRKHLLAADEGWEVWTDWYEDRLHGRPFNKALEEARVLIDPEIWEQGPRVVNAEIARLIAEHTPTLSDIRQRLASGAKPQFGDAREIESRATLQEAIAELRPLIEAHLTQHGRIGHNNPPEAASLPVDLTLNINLTLRATDDELEKPQPDVAEVVEAAGALEKVLAWAAAKVDLSLDAFMKAIGTAGSVAVAAALAGFPVWEKIAQVYHALLKWLGTVFPPF